MTLGFQTLKPAVNHTEVAPPLAGEIRHPGLRYSLNVQRRGASLSGRLGGRVFFERLQLEEQNGALHGLLTGNAARLAIYARERTNRLECRFTGPDFSATAELELTDAGASGHLVTSTGSSEINLQFKPHQISGTLSSGEHLWLEMDDGSRVAPIVALLAGTIAARVVHRAQLEFLPGVGGLF